MAGITSGYLCSIPIDYGWPFIFYFHGALAVLWCIFWQVFGTIRPEDHRFISKREKLHIIRTRLGMDSHQSGKKESPPYKEIAKSRPAWGYLLVATLHYFATTLLFSYFPLYLPAVFGLGITEIGLVSSVGHLARFISVILWGRVSNLLSIHTNVGPTVTRKIIQCSALVVLGFMEDVVVALCLLMVILMFQSCTMVSGFVIPLDIAPRYASFLNGVFLTATGIASVPGLIIASLMTSEGTLEQWRNLFLLVSTVYSVGGFSFLLLASADLQPWAIPKGSTAKEEREQPLTPDLMTRRMTVLSAGPPVSPAPHQHRYNFTLTVDANSGQAWYDEDNAKETDEESTTGIARNTTIQAYTTTAAVRLKSNDNALQNGRAQAPKNIRDNAHVNLGFQANTDLDCDEKH
ncbi:hypothetical protein BaRGS_00031950 [Batillaria attramentaria]|uniref:Uncharacterized protein n=1 Tax=Batillaria attramentaria TaxID=370345 RepID=A0ABD0JPI9_9CAEN